VKTPKTHDLIDALLKNQNNELEKLTKSDIIVIKSPIYFGLDDQIRLEIERLCDGNRNKKNKLSVILETTGGYIEVVERIYAVFRKHYKEINYIIPNYAYSAGTVLALSGDNIYMDYYSVLGPIDPQIQGPDGNFVPGLGYLAKFDELVVKINSAPKGTSTTAELAYLLKKFDPAQLFALEQAKNHSEALLEEWLSKHKFKNWKTTAGRGLPVDNAMRRARAKEIARILGQAERWHSHGRGIGLSDLTNDEIKLEVHDFGRNKKLSDAIHSYYNLLIDFCQRTGTKSALHTKLGLRRLT